MNISKPAPEVTDLSLLVLVDLATVPEVGRQTNRLTSLLGGGSPAIPVQPLIDLGLVDARPLAVARVPADRRSFRYTLTERGLLLVQSLLATLKNAAA